MFELKISDLYQALQLSANWATHTVSLVDPGIGDYFSLPVASQNGFLQRYFFHDVEEINTDNLLHFMTEEQLVLASTQQIQDILTFTASLQSKDRLLVHCHAGISRSTAVSCGILCQHGLTPDEAIKYVVSICPYASPNQHILTLFDDILGLGGKLVTTCRLF